MVYHKLLKENSNKLSLYTLDINEYPYENCATLIKFAYKGYHGVIMINLYLENHKKDINLNKLMIWKYMNFHIGNQHI